MVVLFLERGFPVHHASSRAKVCGAYISSDQIHLFHTTTQQLSTVNFQLLICSQDVLFNSFKNCIGLLKIYLYLNILYNNSINSNNDGKLK